MTRSQRPSIRRIGAGMSSSAGCVTLRSPLVLTWSFSQGRSIPMPTPSTGSRISIQAAIDFTDPVEAMEYEHHVESNFPTFGIEDCRACHNAGKFNVPNQGLSMPGVLSNTDFGTIRNIGTIDNDVITGPATRACGACHRAEAIIANAGAGDPILLANLNAPYDHVRLYAPDTAGRNYGRYHQDL